MGQNPESLSERIIYHVKRVPEGKVATYGQIAALAGSPRAARVVVRVLRSCSRTHDLPWHRIISSKGTISLPSGSGFEEQVALLDTEGVHLDPSGIIDLGRYRWEVTS